MEVASIPAPPPLPPRARLCGGAFPLQKPSSSIVVIDDSESPAEGVFPCAMESKAVPGAVVILDDEDEEAKEEWKHRSRNPISSSPTPNRRFERNGDAVTDPQAPGKLSNGRTISSPEKDKEAANKNEAQELRTIVSGAQVPTIPISSTCAQIRPRAFAVRDYPVGCGPAAYRSIEAIRNKSDLVCAETNTPKIVRDCSEAGVVPSARPSSKSSLSASKIEMPSSNGDVEKVIVSKSDNADASFQERLRSRDKEQDGAMCVKEDLSTRHCTPSANGSVDHTKEKTFKAVGEAGEGAISKYTDPASGLDLEVDNFRTFKKRKLVPIRGKVTPDGSLNSIIADGPAKESGPSARALVKQTLHEFESIRRALLKAQTAGKRPDMEASSILKEKGRWRNHGVEKLIGEVPGVEVGDQFIFRIEMLIIGLHRQPQGGIDFVPGSRRSDGRPVATSIVASGGYEDDDDGGDTFIYTGQGGNNYKGDKRQEKDQKLERGNLAMSNSCKQKIPVRVIRGSSDVASPTKTIYNYDGLYDIVDYWFKRGLSGYGVYQFKLARRPGQPELGPSIVKFVGNLKKKGLARPNLLLEDISRGKERRPVCVVNEVDDEPRPADFEYIAHMKYPSGFSPELPKGCDCVGACVDEEKCLCASRNGGEFPYNENGLILRAKPVVYECGSSCRCSSSCQNRVSQRGLRYQLEIFKTKNKGWGVRSLDSIRSGGFICEYTGELLSDEEAEKRTGNDEYLFDVGNKWNSWDDVSELMDVSPSTAVLPVVEDAGFSIDAKGFGNVARFINHSCSPNLYAQNVIFDTHDLKTPHVMLFAMGTIPPMRELTYDYNYSIGHVRDANGNVKTKACYCGAVDCEGRLY